MNLKRHWHWGTRIAIVYAIFAAGTLGFAAFAMSRDVDLVSPDYYTAAIAYDSRQAAARRALDLRTIIGINRADNGRDLLSITFPDTAPPQSASVTLYRASDSRADRSMPIDVKTIDAAGRVLVTLHGLAAGSWTVQLSWTSGGRSFYVEQRVVVP